MFTVPLLILPSWRSLLERPLHCRPAPRSGCLSDVVFQGSMPGVLEKVGKVVPSLLLLVPSWHSTG